MRPSVCCPDLRPGGRQSAPRGWRCCRTGWPRSHPAAHAARRAGDLLIVVRVAVGHGLDAAHLGAERLDQRIFFRRLVVGHDDDAAIAARVADMRQPDAGIAGGALDHGAAGRELARAARHRSTMARAARSLTEPPGFMNSALPRISQPVSSLTPAAGSAACARPHRRSPCTIFMRCADVVTGVGSACDAASALRARAGCHLAHDQQRRRRDLARCAPARRCRRGCRRSRAARASVARSMIAAGRSAGAPVRAQARDDARQLRHAHVEHHGLQRRGERAPVEASAPSPHGR